MRHLRWLLALAALCAFSAHAVVPAKFSYQGFLTTPGGNPISASLSMTFSLWDDPAAGSQAWTESQTVAVNAGHFNVILGNLTPIAAVFDKPYYLQVQIGADPAMTPRQPLTSVPYAAASGLPGCSAGDLINCYIGPAGTLGVGTCKAGVRSCTSSGTYGPCTGQVTPTAEVVDGLDNDCNGTADNGALGLGAACSSPASCASGFCIEGTCASGLLGLGAACTSPASCATGFCVGGVCSSSSGLADGSACGSPASCTSGYCVDGICSNSVCSGACQSPNAAHTGGTNGICANVTAGTDPHNACGAPYGNCSGASSSCPTSCASDAVCATNFYCDGANSCVPKKASGSACAQQNECASGSCAGGYCCSGACGAGPHSTASCSAGTGTCGLTCDSGYLNCNGSAGDGCECSTPLCCGAGCGLTHANGLGQSYYDCAPLGVPGNASTYSQTMAIAAAQAWTFPGSIFTATCAGGAQTVVKQGPVGCSVWTYTGANAGYVHFDSNCLCPSGTDPTWN